MKNHSKQPGLAVVPPRRLGHDTMSANIQIWRSSRVRRNNSAAIREVKMRAAFRMLAATLLFLLSFDANAASGPKIAIEEFMVPTPDPEVHLYVRNKDLQGVTKFPGEKFCSSCMDRHTRPRPPST